MAGIGHVHRVLAFGPQVSDNSGTARYAEVRALVKENTPASPFVVANEAIATALGQVLALPVPAGGIIQADGDGLAWASWHFGPGGQRPPPVIPAHMVADHPALSAAVVAFDCWIANDDRHPGNLAYKRDLVPVAVFDQGHALLGPTGQGVARLIARRDGPHVAGCLHPEMDTAVHFGMLAEEIGAIPRRRIEAICRSVQQSGAIDHETTDHVVDFLDHRKSRIMELLYQAAPDFPGITEWSMT
ncbi:MAG: hypothetical protein ACR2HR_07280 [Euzebya sp.]